MGKGVVHLAQATSENTVSFKFPYTGFQRASLILRSHPKHGKDVIFKIQKGQLLYQSYEASPIQIRFDEAEGVTFQAVGGDDLGSTTIFIKDYHRFVGKMLKAENVRISPTVYEEGHPIFEFDVSNFSESQYLQKE